MLGSIDTDTMSLFVNVLTLILAAFAIYVAYSELRAARKAAWADFLLRLDQRFLEDPICDISAKIEDGTFEPMKYDDKWTLINYLATFELFYEFQRKKILDKDIVAHYYANSILKAYYYPGMSEFRKQSGIDWSRLEQLVESFPENIRQRVRQEVEGLAVQSSALEREKAE
jgi:hypothetical protein